MRNYFDITLLYCTTDKERLRKMQRLVKCEVYEKGKEYKCDIFIRNSVWGIIPEGIKAKRMIEMRHANYKFLLDEGKLYQQYAPMPGINEIVGCGAFVSQMSNEVLHDNPTTIRNILLPKKKVNKVLRLISCTRIDPDKGWNNMIKLCDMLRKANIKFTWDIFTNATNYKTDYEEIKFWKQRDDIFDYVANADYTVLLSKSEGMPYTIQESLQYNTPCIVSNVGGCIELIKDGVNGYVIPLDSKYQIDTNFNVEKLLDIPICEDYDNNAEELWLKYLGYIGERKPIEEVREVKMRVRALNDFAKIIDSETGKERIPGEEWVIDEFRYNQIKDYEQAKELKLIEVIEEPKEEKKVKKTNKKVSDKNGK